MKKELRVVDEARGMVQVTTTDSRWYTRPSIDPTTGLPRYDFVPSVTWICDFYPKSVQFFKWLAQTGWDEAQALKEAAGDKGSKIHHAISRGLVGGEPIQMDDVFPHPSTGVPEPLTVEEYAAVLSFKAWLEARSPRIVAQNLIVWNDEHSYAGTLDLVFIEPPVLWLPDIKTSKAIWPSHELQVSAYRHTPAIDALMQQYGCTEAKLAILQVGYARNAGHWKFTEVPDQFALFLATQQIWAKDTAGQQPAQKDYPLSVSLSGYLASAPTSPTALGRESMTLAAVPNGRRDDGIVKRLGKETK